MSELDSGPLLLAPVIVAVGLSAQYFAGVPWAGLAAIIVAVGINLASAGWWRSFWFTPISGSWFAVWRSLLGFIVFLYALSLIPDLDAFFGPSGILPDPFFRPTRVGLLRWWNSETAVRIVYAGLVVSSLAVMLGRGLRLAAPAMWFSIISLHQANPLLLNGGDDLLRIWAAYFAIFCLVAPARVLRVPLRGSLDEYGERSWGEMPGWLRRIAQLQLTVIYPATFWAKLPGETWQEGTAALWSLGLLDFARFPLPDVVVQSLWVGRAMTWTTFALELLLPILLWIPKTRRFAIAAGMTMHLGFGYAMRLGFFTWAIALAYLAFLRPSEVEALLRRILGGKDSSRLRESVHKRIPLPSDREIRAENS